MWLLTRHTLRWIIGHAEVARSGKWQLHQEVSIHSTHDSLHLKLQARESSIAPFRNSENSLATVISDDHALCCFKKTLQTNTRVLNFGVSSQSLLCIGAFNEEMVGTHATDLKQVGFSICKLLRCTGTYCTSLAALHWMKSYIIISYVRLHHNNSAGTGIETDSTPENNQTKAGSMQTYCRTKASWSWSWQRLKHRTF